MEGLGRAPGLQVGVPGALSWGLGRAKARLTPPRGRQSARNIAPTCEDARQEAGLQVSGQDLPICGDSRRRPCLASICILSHLFSPHLRDFGPACLPLPSFWPRRWPWRWVGLTSCLSSCFVFILPGLAAYPTETLGVPSLGINEARSWGQHPASLGGGRELREFFDPAGRWELPFLGMGWRKEPSPPSL